MGRLQCNFTEHVCDFIVGWKCVHQNIADSFYCCKGTIALSLSSTVVWTNCNQVYLIDTVIWHRLSRLKYFIQGNWQLMRVLLYTFCTGHHFKQINWQKASATELASSVCFSAWPVVWLCRNSGFGSPWIHLSATCFQVCFYILQTG